MSAAKILTLLTQETIGSITETIENKEMRYNNRDIRVLHVCGREWNGVGVRHTFTVLG